MYSQGVVSVGTSPTRICSPGPGGAHLQNLGAAVVYVGSSTVTANAAATGGVQLPAAMTAPVLIPVGLRPGTYESDPTADDIYGRVAAGSRPGASTSPSSSPRRSCSAVGVHVTAASSSGRPGCGGAKDDQPFEGSPGHSSGRVIDLRRPRCALGSPRRWVTHPVRGGRQRPGGQMIETVTGTSGTTAGRRPPDLPRGTHRARTRCACRSPVPPAGAVGPRTRRGRVGRCLPGRSRRAVRVRVVAADPGGDRAIRRERVRVLDVEHAVLAVCEVFRVAAAHG